MTTGDQRRRALAASVRRRSLATIILSCALVFGQTVAAHAQDASAAPVEAGPTDVALPLPDALGETPLVVERFGPEEVAARMARADDVLFVALQAVLEDLGGDTTDLRAEVATSEDGRYRLTALQIGGLDAPSVLTALFTELLGEQLRASGVDDQATVDDMAERLESVLPWKEVEGREIVSPQAGSDTTFELVYPAGEVLYLVQGQDGLTMAEVLAALPEQVEMPG